MFKVGDILISKKKGEHYIKSTNQWVSVKGFHALRLLHEEYGTQGPKFNWEVAYEGIPGWRLNINKKQYVSWHKLEKDYRVATEMEILLYFSSDLTNTSSVK